MEVRGRRTFSWMGLHLLLTLMRCLSRQQLKKNPPQKQGDATSQMVFLSLNVCTHSHANSHTHTHTHTFGSFVAGVRVPALLKKC